MIPALTPALRAAARATALGVIATETLAAAATLGAPPEAELRRARAALFARAARRTLGLHDVRVRAAGPLPEPGALLVANHVSYLDPLAVAAEVPCLPVSKADLAAWPVLGAVARRTGVLFVERGDPASGLRVMRAVRRALEEGLSVLNFPEGTTTAGDGVLAFRRGLFSVAHRAGAPVVPVAIAYDPPDLAWIGEATFVPHYLRLASRAAAEVHVTFGAPLATRAYPDAVALADAAHARVRTLLEDRAAWLRKTP